MIHRLATSVFVLALALALLGGILLVLAQAASLVAGRGDWLITLNDSVKIPIVLASSVCAIAGFVMNYGRSTAPVSDDGVGTK